MRSIRTRLERLERENDTPRVIRWENLAARRIEDIVPDGIIDWYRLLFSPRTDDGVCPIEEKIRQAGLRTPETEAGSSPAQPKVNDNHHSH
jgi:hypothetical protein